MTLQNQTAVITGAGSGIGRAIALGLARRQARICLVGRRPDRLNSTARDAGVDARAACYPTDLSVDAEMDALIQRLHQETGPVDILVHSAGTISLGSVETSSIDELDVHYRTNVRAVFRLTQALLPGLLTRRGQIVFINSSAALDGRAGLAHYAATKAAMKAMAESLRQEVNPCGVRVLSVFLGRTASPMQADVCRTEGREYHPELLMQPDDVAEVVNNALLLPRTVEVTEIRMRPLAKSY